MLKVLQINVESFKGVAHLSDFVGSKQVVRQGCGNSELSKRFKSAKSSIVVK